MLQNDGIDDTLIAPVLAEKLVEDDRRVVLCACREVLASAARAARHRATLNKAGARAGQQIVAGDGTSGVSPFPDLDGQRTLTAAVAVAVRHHQGAAAFDKLGKVRVVVLAARQQDLAAVLGSAIRNGTK